MKQKKNRNEIKKKKDSRIIIKEGRGGKGKMLNKS
jgi:hypothetical protein